MTVIADNNVPSLCKQLVEYLKINKFQKKKVKF